MLLKSFFSALLLTLTLSPVYAETIRVAVAANFTAPMKQIAEAFQQQTGNELLLSFASSGKFYAQILNNAPYDVFLSADQKKPQALVEQQLAVADSRFTYAVGVLALWSMQKGLVDEGGTILQKGNFQWLAIANPRLAPYGSAAVEVLENLKLYAPLKARIVEGENISQTFQFVRTGNAELGFIALSQLKGNDLANTGSYWQVPASLHTPIRQDAVLLKSAQNPAAATELLNFLRSDKARAIITDFGYGLEM